MNCEYTRRNPNEPLPFRPVPAQQQQIRSSAGGGWCLSGVRRGGRSGNAVGVGTPWSRRVAGVFFKPCSCRCSPRAVARVRPPGAQEAAEGLLLRAERDAGLGREGRRQLPGSRARPRARPFPSGVSATHVDPPSPRDLRDLVSSAPATVVGVYFRENAVAHLRSWTEPLSSKGTRTMEVCCVESLLFRAGPLRSLVLRGLRTQREEEASGKEPWDCGECGLLWQPKGLSARPRDREQARGVLLLGGLLGQCEVAGIGGGLRAGVRSLWGAAQALESGRARGGDSPGRKNHYHKSFYYPPAGT